MAVGLRCAAGRAATFVHAADGQAWHRGGNPIRLVFRRLLADYSEGGVPGLKARLFRPAGNLELGVIHRLATVRYGQGSAGRWRQVDECPRLRTEAFFMSHDYSLGTVDVSLTPLERFEEFLQSRGKRVTQQRRIIVERVFQPPRAFRRRPTAGAACASMLATSRSAGRRFTAR